MHVLVAAFFGVKPRGARPPPGAPVDIGAPADVGQLMATLGDGDPYQGCAGPALYDFAALKALQSAK